jgi:hypothetical protein
MTKKADTKKGKPTRVQFAKGATAQEIVNQINKIHDDWAKKYPERAHRLYPKVFDENGDRIKPKQ